MEHIYAKYAEYAGSCSLDDFKSHQNYTPMLEHVRQEYSLEYFNLLKSHMSNADISEFCKLNDAFGNPKRHIIPELSLGVSGTSLRYLFHAWIILTNRPESSPIVEVGCGYGGLCLAIDFLSKKLHRAIPSYTCIDLDGPLSLQKRYLSNFHLSFPVQFVASSTYGSDIQGSDNFLVSSYCFSEISKVYQKKYIDVLFPKVSHGFIAWNNIPLYDFGKSGIRSEPERPMTGRGNLFVYF